LYANAKDSQIHLDFVFAFVQLYKLHRKLFGTVVLNVETNSFFHLCISGITYSCSLVSSGHMLTGLQLVTVVRQHWESWNLNGQMKPPGKQKMTKTWRE